MTVLKDAADRLVRNNDFLTVFMEAKTELAEAVITADPLNLPALQAASLRHEALVALLEYIESLAKSEPEPGKGSGVKGN